ncbi:MAG: class I SAM-dependent methyltransferase [Candidatus Levybacteria bacterium]|nr:class I SAM-dependent methyltransferase [Candidatus Levybacteria bacterium]
MTKIVEEIKKKGWDRVAEVYSRDRRGGSIHHKYYNDPALLDLIRDVKGKKVLDAGCGEGILSRDLARKGARVTGIDLSNELIEFAKQEEERRPLGIRYFKSSLVSMSYLKDGEFDSVISSLVLHDLEPLEDVLREIYRVLRKSGEFCISLVHPMTKRDEKYFEKSWREFDWGGEYPTLASYHRTISDYINSFIKVGFSIEEVQEPRPLKEGLKYHELKMWNTCPLYILFKLRK